MHINKLEPELLLKLVEKKYDYKLLEYIDSKYYTDDLINFYVEKNTSPDINISIKDSKLCTKYVNKYPRLILNIHDQDITRDICVELVKKNVSYLRFCPSRFLDRDMFYLIFKHESLKKIRRKERFDFILDYNDDDLIRIISAYPNLLQIVPVIRQKNNNKICLSAITSNSRSREYMY